ncbi:unnamed protein product [Acanthoscelides obtectus]|uniref:Uncharacterized protein n=1 Tax=Acanthoscelides obtectus TaxID=200917 RepID=A0A9P0QEA3_ACAOB|nr:unnamed protein product [Acanthoscelides obtectus]CAK1635839.1 hypothetical protein AOBTE_LOCUS9551 [Acanthoscelides obtectus]
MKKDLRQHPARTITELRQSFKKYGIVLYQILPKLG